MHRVSVPLEEKGLVRAALLVRDRGRSHEDVTKDIETHRHRVNDLGTGFEVDVKVPDRDAVPHGHGGTERITEDDLDIDARSRLDGRDGVGDDVLVRGFIIQMLFGEGDP